MSTSEILYAAAVKVGQGWTRHELARGEDGRSADPASPAAVSWCAAGAMQAVCGGATGEYTAARESFRDYLRSPISAWNDDPCRKQDDVVEALRRAARLAEAA